MRRARKPINQINVVPYIDVMLVLLVIFMITAPLVAPVLGEGDAVSFLAPLSLFLGAAALVPLLIHLMRRRIGLRVEFPAARYLARAEQEHSRTLRLRNLLLMLLRVLVVLLVAMAAARPVTRWVGGGHAPTALAIVLDNSLSTSVVQRV